MFKSIFYSNLYDRFILTFSHQVSVLIAILLMGIRLDESSFGLISIYLILFQLSFIMTEWGYSIFALHIVNEKNENYLSNSFIDVLFSKFFFVILSLCIIFIFFYFNSKLIINNNSLIFLTLSILSAAFNPLWFLQAISQVKILILPTILARLCFLIIIIFFVNSDNLELFFLGQFISFLLPTLFGNFFVLKKKKIQFIFNIKKILQIKKLTAGIFLSTLIQNQIFSLWGFYLTLVSNPIQIGYFMLAEQILRAGNSLNNIFQEIIMSTKNKVDFKSFKNNIIILIFLTLIISIFGFFSIEFIFEIFFKNKFLEAISVIKLTIISWFFITIIKITNYPIINNFEDFQKLNLISIKVLFVNLLLILVNFIFFEKNALNASLFFLLVVIIHFFLNTFFISKKFKFIFF